MLYQTTFSSLRPFACLIVLLPSLAQSYVELNLTNSNTQQSLKIVWEDNVLTDGIVHTTINTGGLCLTSSSQMNCNTSPMTDTTSDGLYTNHNNTTVRWYGDDDHSDEPTFLSWGAFAGDKNISDWSTITFQDLGSVDASQSSHLQAMFVDVYDNYINQFDGQGWQVSIASVSEVPLPAGIYLFLSGLVGLGLMRGRNA